MACVARFLVGLRFVVLIVTLNNGDVSDVVLCWLLQTLA